eukprot:scaffold2914_cov156-Ochromonas_danica.AAC.8
MFVSLLAIRHFQASPAEGVKPPEKGQRTGMGKSRMTRPEVTKNILDGNESTSRLVPGKEFPNARKWTFNRQRASFTFNDARCSAADGN